MQSFAPPTDVPSGGQPRPWRCPPQRAAHPQRLQALAYLLRQTGLGAPSAYLQLDSGDGGHLLGLAASEPECTFVGLEASETLRSEASRTAAKAQLRNVRFLAPSELELEPDTFDFVAWCKGYATSAPSVQTQLLKRCRDWLRPRGVLLLGYEVLPGARLAQLARGITRKASTGASAASELRAALSLLCDAPAGGRGVELLRPELDALGALDDESLQDELLLESQPVMFHRLVKALETAGLSYVAEAARSESAECLISKSPLLPEAASAVEREQYADIWSGRRLRRSLVCRAEDAVDVAFDQARIASLWALSPLRRTRLADKLQFTAPGGRTIEVLDPLLAATLERLGARFPEALGFDELLDELELPRTDSASLTAALGAGYERDLLDLLGSPSKAAHQVPEKPQVSPLALVELELGRPMTNLLHIPVRARSRFSRTLLPLLDGTRDVDALVSEAASSVTMTEAELRRATQEELSWLTRQAMIRKPRHHHVAE